jgi:hypothetical protein
MNQTKKKIEKVLPDRLAVEVKHSPVEVSLEWERRQRRRKEDLPGHVRKAEREP